MTYLTIAMAHDAIMNELNATNMQLSAVRKKLKEFAEADKAYLKDVFGNPIQRTDYENFQKKLMNLRAIEMRLSKKAEELADAVDDFNKHNW